MYDKTPKETMSRAQRGIELFGRYPERDMLCLQNHMESKYPTRRAAASSMVAVPWGLQ